MTTNSQFAYINYADVGTLSGGSWVGTLPLANLQNRRLSKVARATNALAASSVLDLDLADALKPVRLVGLLKHNISSAGTYRVTAGTSAGASDVYDSGTLLALPALYSTSSLEWEDANWWFGTATADDLALYPVHLLHDCGASKLARYWRLQITDTANAAGYVQAGRLWAGPMWEPDHDYDLGAGLQWEPRSEVEYSLGGAAFFDERAPARICTFSLHGLTYDRAYGNVLDIQRRVRNDKELIFIPDKSDTARRFRRDIYGRLRTIDPLVQASAAYQSAGFQIEELL